MKKLLLLALFLFCDDAVSQNLKIMTFNIRYNTVNDGVNQWDNRKDYAAQILNYYQVDICGMQEALIGQINDLQQRLPNYAWIGLGRDDGKEKGEFSPVFYRKDKFKMLKHGTFWLSENPDFPNIGWDASLPRVVTWGYFQNMKTKKKFYVFNTHFDHMGKVARAESARLILRKVKTIAGDKTAFIIGDFNATQDSDPIKIINSELKNTMELSQSPHFGPIDTFTGFESKERPNSQIDHIFTNKPGLKVLSHATLSNTWGGLFASDHHPVLIEVGFK
jgi:endonuclease/exonuclease/phosphatase family metal-dependent hydrolase